jgi:CHRD domain
MRFRAPIHIPAVAAAISAMGATLILAATALAAPVSFSADLADAGAGDADGSGTAAITIDTETGEVCWELSVSGIGDVVASHIHEGAEGEDGGVVVPLDVDGFTDSSEGCVTPDGADLAAIVDNPSGYYVNIHTAEFSAGAIRGQLSATGETPDTAITAPSSSPLSLLGVLVLAVGAIGGLRLALRRR